MRVPLFELNAAHADLFAELDHAWQHISRSGQFVGGEFVERFEEEWAQYCGARHCVGVANGTDAIELALAALGIGPGDEVIVPANTFIATAEAAAAAGATPVFVDVDPSTLLVTASHVESAITARTAAVIVVHLYGQPVDMDAICRIGKAAGIAVIEDAAQAHGAEWNGRRVGSLADAGCFSFYPSKNLGAFGDAGAVVTRDFALAERIRRLGDHGRSRSSRFHHEVIGRNSRLDGLQAAILSVKLKHLDNWTSKRRQVARQYEAALADTPLSLQETAPGALHSYHLAVVRTPHRDALRLRLAGQGIETGVHYPIPCHLQPAFAGAGALVLPIVELAAQEILSLPMFPHLTAAQISHIASAIVSALADPRPGQRLAS